MGTFRHGCALAAAAALACGCAELLPKSQAEVSSRWHSFEEARDAIERIQPGKTTTDELRAAGIDPYISANVQILTFSDIALRFPLNVPADRLDHGLRQCLEAGKACTGYSISVRDVKRDRVGGFWQDAFGFKRITDVSGWSFNALLLLVDERVVYTLYGGQPNLREQEITRQPLGPVQNFGDSVPLGGLVK
ncbi:MAG TPA: hypothetical protein VFK48_15915 [Usitatibacter sp.]|nr:hypothetical protein [Usitatibacter sp.]